MVPEEAVPSYPKALIPTPPQLPPLPGELVRRRHRVRLAPWLELLAWEEVEPLLANPLTRAALLELFQGLLFGDSLAAEYLLCHLISTV